MLAPKNFTPKEIVSELDKHIVGQTNAKKAVAIALRNRWRRKQLDMDLQKEVMPKNILMIGPTGVGKTEIARRLSKLDNAPFIKVEATKFTEIGYVGRDVEQIIRDLVEVAIRLTSLELKKSVNAKAEVNAKQRIVDILAGEDASPETKKKFATKLKNGSLDDSEIEISVKEKPQGQSLFDVPGMPGAQMGVLSIDSFLGKEKYKTKKVSVKKALELFMEEEADSLIDKDNLITLAIENVENNGLVFIDEIDKIASSNGRHGGDVSREGVQRDLLPLVEGTTVSTKYGPIKTDYILFIASGAFHLSKPSDLLPELQGRFPIRVELNALTKDDFKRILTEPVANLILQYKAMLAVEKLNLVFEDSAIDEIADLAVYFNNTIENIGARRLHTILENILEEINFTAPDKFGQTITITKDFVKDKVKHLKVNNDLSKFVI
jgi:ATP-dependent HslUV protease ATP-binding subunit HslU